MFNITKMKIIGGSFYQMFSSSFDSDIVTYNSTIHTYGKKNPIFVEALINLYVESAKNIRNISGDTFNIGGGPKNTLSILELVMYLDDLLGTPINFSFSEWRPGDKRIFIANIQKVYRKLGWKPKVSIQKGIEILLNWVEKIKI